MPHVEPMSHRRKFLSYFWRNPRLNHYVAPAHWADGEARILQRLLNIHTIIDHIRNKLRVSEGLVRAPHDAEANMLISMLHERQPGQLSVQGSQH